MGAVLSHFLAVALGAVAVLYVVKLKHFSTDESLISLDTGDKLKLVFTLCGLSMAWFLFFLALQRFSDDAGFRELGETERRQAVERLKMTKVRSEEDVQR
mmetsp:Transcript_29591/g.58055  ORF Transcript_29591/g.58055 Transcript_29591/m.58055 type:complete len:100 (+) Transcript_29591:340-639(+)